MIGAIRSMRCAISLGEFRELTALAASPRDRLPLEPTGEMVAKDAPDQLVVNGGEGRSSRARSVAA
jgi:hypothetical protein